MEDSLRRLGTDWIDIYYIHHVDVETELDEMLYAVDALVRQGKVRYPACSNYEAWRLSEALWLSDHHGLARFACYQPQYSLVVRDIELELLPLCRYKRLGVAVWAPLAGGFLAGKYRPGMQVRQGSRSADGWAYPAAYFAPTADATLALLLERAPETGRTPAQVALRWVLERPGITSAIVGARDVEQLHQNLGAAGWRLDAGACRGADRGERAGAALPAGDGSGNGAAPRRRRHHARPKGEQRMSWQWELRFTATSSLPRGRCGTAATCTTPKYTPTAPGATIRPAASGWCGARAPESCQRHAAPRPAAACWRARAAGGRVVRYVADAPMPR